MLGELDGVGLRPAETADVAAMYRVGTAAWMYWTRLFGRGRPNPHEFGSLLGGPDEQFIVEIDDEVVGVAELYDHAETSATAWLGVALLPLSDGDAVRSRVASRMAEYAFRTMALRKLYVLDHGFCSPMFADTPRYVEESCVPEAFLFGGRYWDERVRALYPDPAAQPAPAIAGVAG